MSDDIKNKAVEAETLVQEVTAVALPDPTAEIVSLEEADEPVSAEIRKRMDEIDMGNTNSIVAFGSSAQSELQA